MMNNYAAYKSDPHHFKLMEDLGKHFRIIVHLASVRITKGYIILQIK